MPWPPPAITRVATTLEPRLPGLTRAARRSADRALDLHASWRYRRYPDPGMPWTGRYRRNQRRALTTALADASLLSRLAAGSALPEGYAVGYDERLVELPWLVAQAPAGKVLDAGSTTNHAFLLPRLLPRTEQLVIVTLEPGRPAAAGPVSYLNADLRDLPLRSDLFDTVVCISTLEHIGLDNSRWGVPPGQLQEPGEDRMAALSELRRVTAPGGRVLITVPYGVPERHSWFEQFGPAEVEATLAALAPADASTTVYRYGPSGWQLSDPADAAGCRYQVNERSARHHEGDDRAAAARAVACLALRL